MIYREADDRRRVRLYGSLGLAVAVTSLFLFVAWVGFGSVTHIVGVLCGGGIVCVGLILNTWVVRSPRLHLVLTTCIAIAGSPVSIVLAWYATRGFGLASAWSDLTFAAILLVIIALSVAETRQADLAAFERELYKRGGLRRVSDDQIEFRLRGAPQNGPYGAYFRPFKAVKWFEIAFSISLGTVTLIVAPFAFTSVSEPIQALWVFPVMFIGVGWLLRIALTGVVVNWRLLSFLRRNSAQ
ncbi:hypothetical protein JMK10_19205 [Rhodovulum sulfidophilum]|uniref:hypothetical protein n=1 Tax=Rhodovulum sulfidophilum TaxID=35806 RepID=UPI0019242AF5|nr:hypothetical protein [Rhodovulum sulfidophilum]MBL3576077.1 hypothetical protein [Rhodovulum sulfidophilum]MCE8433185.1 hypothetical protein [Rhodovulum sulfidophilum]MCF4118867.1 hypothetical protein [Rhodovulum sulfidophilum]